jgi:hypothetical protein
MDNIDALDDAVKRYPLGVTAAIHARFLALGSIIASQQAAISELKRHLPMFVTSRLLTQVDLEALMEAIESAQRRIDEVEEHIPQPSPNEIVNRALLRIGAEQVIERLKVPRKVKRGSPKKRKR